MTRPTDRCSCPFETVDQLEDALGAPTEDVVETLSRLDSDIIVLGAAGKMGPTLARMARRALDACGSKARVIAVSRFSSPGSREQSEAHGIETIACDLLDESKLDALPRCPNVIYMAGMKFGTTGAEAMTWAMNAYLPGAVARRFVDSRIVAFSTGNVYGLVNADSGGSIETDIPKPVGEYAMSCLARERMFEHFSRANGTPTALIRLNYATELRYGVLVDLATRVRDGQPIDVTMGYLNAIWQGDANAMTLRALDHVNSPPTVLNIAGLERLAVRDVAYQFGQWMGKPVTVMGTEAEDALLNNAARATALFGPPRVLADELIEWTAHWIDHGGGTLGKPTHFESRDGTF